MKSANELPLETMAALMDSLNCGAFIVDRAGIIIQANQRAGEMLDRPVEELIQHPLESLYSSPDDIETVRKRVADFDTAFEEEFHVPTARGSNLPIIISSRPLGDARLAVAYYKVITIIDIARQKKLEHRLTEDYQEISKLSDTVLTQAIELKHYSERLENKVRERTTELREANMESIYMLAVASEARDHDTGAHVLRIRRYTELIAREIGLAAAEVERCGYSAVLHDVGKMSIPDSILKKPGPLTGDERRIIQGHTLAGEKMLSRKPFFELARKIARSHHENWNGSGYPDGLAGDLIPLAARIVRLVDVYDALLSARVYKPAWSRENAAEVIRKGRGDLFDPALVTAFERIESSRDFVEIAK